MSSSQQYFQLVSAILGFPFSSRLLCLLSIVYIDDILLVIDKGSVKGHRKYLVHAHRNLVNLAVLSSIPWAH